MIKNYKKIEKYENYNKFGIKDFFINEKENLQVLPVLINKNLIQMSHEKKLIESEEKYKKILKFNRRYFNHSEWLDKICKSLCF